MNDGYSPLDAILFDFMGVLLFLRGDYAPEKIVDAVDNLIGGVVDDDVFRTAVRAEIKVDEDEFQRILKRIPEKYETYPPLWDLLPALRKKYKLGIINNGTRLTFPYFDAKLKLSDRFDAILSSGAEGIRKPDPQIYLRASTRLNIEPRRCLFMDDSEANILGATRAGMQTVHWKNREEGFQRFIERLKADGWEPLIP
jgi:HAD superfamily hydrolase (TIGR01509 family)